MDVGIGQCECFEDMVPARDHIVYDSVTVMQKALAVAAVAAVMWGGAVRAQTTAPAADVSPAISASPNPVPHGPGGGRATITWTTGNKTDGVVRVSTDGGIERVFASGASGSTTVDWIASDKVYEFRLYSATAAPRAAPLASVRITRAQPPATPTITADPNPVPPGAGFGTTTIKWSTGDRSDGDVFVAVNGGPERLFTKGPSGSLAANWIVRTSVVDFRLYSASQPRRLLASVRLEPSMAKEDPVAPGAGPAQSAVLVAHPNPVPSGFAAGETVVSWDTGHLATGRVLVSVNGGPAQPFGTGPRGAGHAAIVTGSVYEFRLYSSTTLLASIIVTRRDPYSMLFWIVLTALIVVTSAYIRRIRRIRPRA